MLVDRLEVARAADDHRRLTAGGYQCSAGPHLFDHSFENAVDHAYRAVIKTGTHAVHGVSADDVFGRAEIDQRQARGLTEESLDSDTDADGDGAAEVFAGGGDHV